MKFWFMIRLADIQPKYEQSFFWQDPATGLLLKARPDILHEDMIVDLKNYK